MHQNPFGGRALPGPAGGAYSAPPDLLAGFCGGEERRGRKEGEGKREVKGRKGEGKRKGGNILDPLAQ